MERRLRDFALPGNVARGHDEGFYPEFNSDFDVEPHCDDPEPVKLPHAGGAAGGATPLVEYTVQQVGPPLVQVKPNPVYQSVPKQMEVQQKFPSSSSTGAAPSSSSTAPAPVAGG